MSKQMLDSHMASNHGGAKFTCGVCQSAYTHPSTLSAHIQKYHKDPDNQVPCLANGCGEGLCLPKLKLGRYYWLQFSFIYLYLAIAFKFYTEVNYLKLHKNIQTELVDDTFVSPKSLKCNISRTNIV